MAIPRNQLEIRALDSFRSMVQDLEFGDGVLMRFLRARDLDMHRAEDMLRKFTEWRINAKCNHYPTGWTIPFDLFNLEVYLTGFDDEGRPVVWVPYGTWPSFRDMIDRGMNEDIIKWSGKWLEKLYQLLLLTKHQQFIVLLDCDGITFSKMVHEASGWTGLSTLAGLLKDYEKNFPELLHKAIIFNAPRAFMWGWKFLSPCLAPYTMAKIKFFGSGSGGRKELEAALFDLLPPSCIPPAYGGHATLTHFNQDLVQVWELEN